MTQPVTPAKAAIHFALFHVLNNLVALTERSPKAVRLYEAHLAPLKKPIASRCVATWKKSYFIDQPLFKEMTTALQANNMLTLACAMEDTCGEDAKENMTLVKLRRVFREAVTAVPTNDPVHALITDTFAEAKRLEAMM